MEREALMKSITALLLLVTAQLGMADDQTLPPKAKPARPAVADTSAARPPEAPKAPMVRPVVPSSSRYSRPTYPTATGNYRVAPKIDQSRTVSPALAARATPVPHTMATPKQRLGQPNNAGARSTRAKLPSRTGSELSFAQAQAQCSHHRHDRDWWRHHHTRIVFYGGGYWCWDAGWWYPAWGYSPYYNNYIYDGPIYGFGALSPGDVTAQVQEALAQQGYYYGAIDGVLGPETRDAILRFQADHGLATTAAIDEPTLDTLGLT